MFMLITGGMRSGKSYLMAKMALDAIALGRVVCTDVPLNLVGFPNLYKWEWSALTDTFITNEERFKRYPYLAHGGVLYLLDEGWKGLKSGDRSIANNLQLMSFFREHGQFINDVGLANDIALCTQNFKSINSQIRELADKTILCAKPSGLGLNNMTLNYHIDGAWSSLRPPRGQNKDLILKIDRLFLDPEVYKCYNSHAKSSTKDGINKGGFDKEGTVSKGNTVFNSLSFRLMLIFSLFCVWFVGDSVASYLNQKNEVQNVQKVPDNLPSVVHPVVVDNSDIGNDPNKGISVLRVNNDKSSNSVVAVKSANSVDAKRVGAVSRIVSVIHNLKTGVWLIHIADKKGHIQRVPPDSCTHDEFGQVECLVGGVRITKYFKVDDNDTVVNSTLFSASK